MMISGFVFVAWFLARVADYGRPSSLARVYGFSWMWGGWWVLLVVAVVFEQELHLVGVYFILIFAALVWLTTWIAYLEMFSLPKKSVYGRTVAGEEPESSTRADGEEDEDGHPVANEETEATERSSLLRRGYRQERENEESNKNGEEKTELPAEPEWSKSQWSILWLLQVIILIPINLVVVGQVALFTSEALHQTGQDGSSMFLLYILIAVCTIMLFSPVVPMLHRFTWHVPIFLLLVLIGTVIYNSTAFPFSMDNRVKLFFQQQIDLEGGNNTVSLTGVSPYTHQAVQYIPSASGQKIFCSEAGPYKSSNRQTCSWSGLPPNVAGKSLFTRSGGNKTTKYTDWLTFNVTRLNTSDTHNAARFVLYGKNTRGCKLVFESSPIVGVHVTGQAPRDNRFPPVPEYGSREVRLWSREWGTAWTVDVSWDDPTAARYGMAKTGNSTMSGKVVCLWSDANQNGVIPAFDEAMHYVPDWVALTKFGDGLVEGYKRFKV